MSLGTHALLLTISLAAQGPQTPVSWSLPDEALGTRISPILLLSRPDVRQELELSPELVEELQGVILGLYQEAAALQGQSGPEVVEARRSIDESARRWIADHLSQQQQVRLEQLDLQWEGASALVSRPTIAGSLDLSSEQRQRLTAVIERPREPEATPMDLHRRRHREAALILTEDQRRRWLAMLGSPFEPSASQAASAISSPVQ